MQKMDFLTQLIEPNRAKVLRFFVHNDALSFTAADLAKRIGISTPTATSEVESLVKIGCIDEVLGEGDALAERKKNARYAWRKESKHANALSTFIHEVSPAEFHDIERALKGAGRLSVIVLSGIFTGDLKRPADIIVVGDGLNEQRLEKAVRSFEPRYGSEIRYVIFSTPEFRYRLTIHDKLLRDTLDYPHRLLLNKNNLV